MKCKPKMSMVKFNRQKYSVKLLRQFLNTYSQLHLSLYGPWTNSC